MTTNQEWLFSLTLEEYLKWMESEHYEPKDDASGYGVVFNIVEPNLARLVMHEPDSRKKLEADANAVAIDYWHRERTWDDANDLKRDVIALLDRQAAITKRETLHDNPTCTANRPTSESADHETAETSEIDASKDEIRDVDVWNVAYEIYCAGGYVDNGNEPNPPTDGIRKLLDRQAAITREEADAGCNECFTEARKRECALGDAIDGLADQVELERRKAIELTNAINELQKKQPYCCNPEQPLDSLNTIGRYIDELTAERDNLKANNQQLHTLAGEQAATIDELTAERKRDSGVADTTAWKNSKYTITLKQLATIIEKCYGWPLADENGDPVIGTWDVDPTEKVELKELITCENCEHWKRFWPESEELYGTCQAWYRKPTRYDGWCYKAKKKVEHDYGLAQA